MTAPLSGLRILSVEQFGAGPYGSLYLANLGAEVIKIEQPGLGDPSRRMGPWHLGDDDSDYFQTFNLHKRSLSLDLKREEGREILHRLVARCDAVMNNLRGSQPARLGLDYPSLQAHNPAIVCAHISAYGRDNERADWPGYDYLMQAEAGFLSLTGEPDTPPARFGLSVIDFMTGVVAALGLVAAIRQAERTGEGADVDVSLFDVALHQLSYPGTWYLNQGAVTGRLPRGAHPYASPSQLCRTADGWIFIMCMTQKFWEILLEIVDRPDLGQDPRFHDLAARNDNRQALTAVLDDVLSARDSADWLSRMQGRIPSAPVLDVAEALDNPFVAATGMVESTPHAANAAFRSLANPIRMNGRRQPGRVCSPLGGDTEALLDEVGYSADEIRQLRGRGVV
ncbi:MAG: CaiB/BaiF CoA-transferase family protein [Gammaproteobacteria bacterium]